MPRIGLKTLTLCTDKVRSLLNEYETELNKAYLHAEGPLKVAMKLTISPDKRGNKVVGDIDFVVDRAKGTSDPGWADEDQLSLLDSKNEKPAERPKVVNLNPRAWSTGHSGFCW